MADFITYDADGRIRERGNCADGTVDQQGGDWTPLEVENYSAITADTHWVENGVLALRPEQSPLVPGAVPWTIPQQAGETVTAINVTGEQASSSDPLEPVELIEAGTYTVHVEAPFPTRLLTQEVTLA